ncbi:MAG: TonB-dependent receptor [Ferruginibacter sp.]|nr:TonB-dependent receptor [Ferruginibacter sp.]
MKKTATIFLLFIGLICRAQQPLSGVLLNEEGDLLPGVAVRSNGFVVYSDSAGRFYLPIGIFPLRFSLSGYEQYVARNLSEAGKPIVMFRPVPLLEETIVRAYEQHAGLKDLPAAVSVLTKTSLERYGNQSLVPAVNTIAGVKMDERSPGSYRLSIRGNLLRSTFGVRNVKVYWNGLPFTDANGTTYINEINFNNIDKIEIIKGPAGSMYGAGTGGVMLLSNAFAAQPRSAIDLTAAVGSYGLFATGVSYKQNTPRSNALLSFNHQQSQGYRDHAAMDRNVLHFTSRMSMSKKSELTTNVFYSDLYYQTPGGLTAAEVSANPRQSRPASGAFKSAEAQRAALYLKTLYGGFSNRVKMNSRWSNTSGIYFSATNFSNPTIRNYEKKVESGIGMRSLFQYLLGNFTGTVGGEYQYGFTNTATFGNRLGALDTLQYRDKISASQYNIFAQAEWKMPAGLALTAGMSLNHFFYGFERQNTSPHEKRGSKFKPQLVPRVALNKTFAKTLSAYFSVSKGFSPPTIDEIHASDGIFNTNLQAESALNYELGFKANLLKNKLWIDVAYYQLQLKQTIVSRRDSSGADYYVNAGRTKQPGFEAALIYRIIDRRSGLLQQLKWTTSYTYSKARFINYQQAALKYDGNRLTGTSPVIFSAGLDIGFAHQLSFNLGFIHTDAMPLNDANSFYGNAYDLGTARINFKTTFGKKLTASFFAVAEKSFDDPYSLGNDLNAAGNRFYNPAAVCTFTVGSRFSIVFR